MSAESASDLPSPDTSEATTLRFDPRPLGRGAYTAGLALLWGVKYLLTAGTVFMGTGTWPTLTQELLPSTDVLADEMMWFVEPSDWRGLYSALVTLLFLWTGTFLTLRRARDAEQPWLPLLFLVPGVRYGAILALFLLPGRRSGQPRRLDAEHSTASILFGALTALTLMVAYNALVQGLGFQWRDHLVVLVLGTQFLAALSSAWFHARGRSAGFWDTFVVGMPASLLCHLALVLFTLGLVFTVYRFWSMFLFMGPPAVLLGWGLARLGGRLSQGTKS